jgi:two-component system, chemotaxis family, chemotaxis protein CheY
MIMQMSSQDWAPLEQTDPGPAMVMIIDDDSDLVCDLSELLESEGYEVATASDGVDALNQLRQGLRPSAILLDLMMPRMDGWDFRHEQMRDAELKEIPTIVLTAAGFSKASVIAQFGSIEFVPKSSGHAVLLRVLKQSCADLA